MPNRTNMRLIDTYRHNKGRLTDLEELKKASKGELEELKALVDFDLASMRDQLEDENRRYKREKTSTNQEWYNRLRLAKNAKGYLSQLIQVELGIIKRQEDADKEKLFSTRLLKAMESLLSLDVRDRVLQRAEEFLDKEVEQVR